jgi:hypothetical protein
MSGRKTLLTHPARREGEYSRINQRKPEQIALYAEAIMHARKVQTTREGLKAAMSDDCEDIIAHDAAWLRELAHQALRLIVLSPPEASQVLRGIWAFGFHAGARHESLTVNMNYLHAVKAQDGIRAGASKGGLARRKITEAAYRSALARKPRNKKQLAGWLDVTTQALRNFEKSLRK